MSENYSGICTRVLTIAQETRVMYIQRFQDTKKNFLMQKWLVVVWSLFTETFSLPVNPAPCSPLDPR